MEWPNCLQFSLEAAQNHALIVQDILPVSHPGRRTTDGEYGRAQHRGKFDTRLFCLLVVVVQM